MNKRMKSIVADLKKMTLHENSRGNHSIRHPVHWIETESNKLGFYTDYVDGIRIKVQDCCLLGDKKTFLNYFLPRWSYLLFPFRRFKIQIVSKKDNVIISEEYSFRIIFLLNKITKSHVFYNEMSDENKIKLDKELFVAKKLNDRANPITYYV